MLKPWRVLQKERSFTLLNLAFPKLLGLEESHLFIYLFFSMQPCLLISSLWNTVGNFGLDHFEGKVPFSHPLILCYP